MGENAPLTSRKCVPCEGGTPALTHTEITPLKEELNRWNIIDDKRLEKTLQFKDFASALAFLNTIANLAEVEGHHPDLSLHSWNKLKITLSTHAIGGLSENDFILAAKIDEMSRD